MQTGEYTFKCRLCDIAFSERDNQKQHTNRHLSVKWKIIMVISLNLYAHIFEYIYIYMYMFMCVHVCVCDAVFKDIQCKLQIRMLTYQPTGCICIGECCV